MLIIEGHFEEIDPVNQVNSSLKDSIKQIVSDNYETYVAVRRDLHMYPELRFEEVRTAGVVAENLTRLGISHRTQVGKTGVVADIKGKHPGPTVLIRADMDALPIQEQTGLPYASKVPNRMHACGHDIHTATLLLVGDILNKLQAELKGNVRLMFQPAEEGAGGAQAMINEGVLDNVEMALGLHNRPEIPVGQFGIVRGHANAAADTFDINIRGKSGHAARPYAAVDPIVAAAQLITQVQTIVARDVKAIHACVVTIGAIHAGEARNVIPEWCEMKGTIRSRHPEAREAAEDGLRRICLGIEQSMRVKIDLDFKNGTPSIYNDERMITKVENAIETQFGDAAIEYEPSMGGEDFSLVAERVPAFRLLIGSSQPGRQDKVHNDNYQPDEKSIAYGAEVLARTVLDILS